MRLNRVFPTSFCRDDYFSYDKRDRGMLDIVEGRTKLYSDKWRTSPMISKKGIPIQSSPALNPEKVPSITTLNSKTMQTLRGRDPLYKSRIIRQKQRRTFDLVLKHTPIYQSSKTTAETLLESAAAGHRKTFDSQRKIKIVIYDEDIANVHKANTIHKSEDIDNVYEIDRDRYQRILQSGRIPKEKLSKKLRHAVTPKQAMILGSNGGGIDIRRIMYDASRVGKISAKYAGLQPASMFDFLVSERNIDLFLRAAVDYNIEFEWTTAALDKRSRTDIKHFFGQFVFSIMEHYWKPAASRLLRECTLADIVPYNSAVLTELRRRNEISEARDREILLSSMVTAHDRRRALKPTALQFLIPKRRNEPLNIHGIRNPVTDSVSDEAYFSLPGTCSVSDKTKALAAFVRR